MWYLKDPFPRDQEERSGGSRADKFGLRGLVFIQQRYLQDGVDSTVTSAPYSFPTDRGRESIV